MLDHSEQAPEKNSSPSSTRESLNQLGAGFGEKLLQQGGELKRVVLKGLVDIKGQLEQTQFGEYIAPLLATAIAALGEKNEDQEGVKVTDNNPKAKPRSTASSGTSHSSSTPPKTKNEPVGRKKNERGEKVTTAKAKPDLEAIKGSDTSMGLKGKAVIDNDQFRNKAILIASRFNFSAADLFRVMEIESKINSAAVNPVSNATGLIQFMPATAKGLGTTIQALKKMSPFDQLDYVEKYLKPYKNHINSYPELYLSVFYPHALNKPDDFVLGSEVSMEYARKVRDQNGSIGPKYGDHPEGLITREAFINFAKKFPTQIWKHYRDNYERSDEGRKKPEKNTGGILLV